MPDESRKRKIKESLISIGILSLYREYNPKHIKYGEV
jgi:ABC-type antimicrobial peptide transport system ATPase subunit